MGLDLDPLAFGSLACMHLAASIGLASLLAGVEFRALFQQGNGTTILLSKVANDWIAAFVRQGVHPPVEMTAHTEMSVVQLEEIIEIGGYQTPAGGHVDPGWKPAAKSEIDRVWGGGVTGSVNDQLRLPGDQLQARVLRDWAWGGDDQPRARVFPGET